MSTQTMELAHLNDLDRPSLPTDFPDYRDLAVLDQDGQSIGRIVDILFNVADRKPLMGVVAFGGFLDIGAKHVLIPFEWFYDPTPTTVHARLSRLQVERAPDFDASKLTEFENYYHYWFPEDVPAQPDPALSPVKGNTTSRHGPLLRISKANEWQIPPGVVDLRGREVVTTNGDRIGVIDDWFLSLTEQRPVIVAIQHGGIFGVLGQEVMAPYERLETADENRFRARITPEEFEFAPELKDELYDFDPFFKYWGIEKKAEAPAGSPVNPDIVPAGGVPVAPAAGPGTVGTPSEYKP